MKALLDPLPQCALEDKTVLPLATGWSKAHVLAIDYGLLPVLASMGPAHITPGWFVLDKDIDVRERAGVVVEPAAREAPERVADQFFRRARRTCGPGDTSVRDSDRLGKPLTRWANRHRSRGLR